jgi:hypothetical protein
MEQEIKQQTPDWANAPEWANWFAIDEHGTGWWCSKKPFIENNIWRVPDGSAWTKSGHFDPTNWRTSLQQRPQTETTTI